MKNPSLFVLLVVIMIIGFVLNPIGSIAFAGVCYVWVDRRLTGLIVLGVLSLFIALAVFALMHAQPPIVFPFPLEPLFFGTPIFGVSFVALTVHGSTPSKRPRRSGW